MKLLKETLKYYNTLKYLKPRQTLGRFYSSFKKKSNLIKLPPIPGELSNKLIPKNNFIFHDPWNTGEDLINGKFNFLNLKRNLKLPSDWQRHDLPLLWQFNLHYFNYLFLLEDHARIELCKDWITKNKTGEGVGWSAYTISLRIVNWLKLNFVDRSILESIYIQTAYLYRNLEFYHPGNHYLENAKALIFSGICFKGAGESEEWLNKGIDIFKKESPVQILNDGGYFELTPMYHAIMLLGYLDILNILPSDHSDYGHFQNTALKMIEFLKSVTHPNGEIALFNDSSLEIAPSTETIIDYARNLISTESINKKYFKESGFFIYRREEIYFIIDVGKIGPDFLPAHSHADIFSYEFSYKKKKFIVDSGVFEYAGSKRNYYRSTAAHNTVSIDSTDQAEVWGSFRVARRYRPYDVNVSHDQSGFKLCGSFDGYSSLIGDGLIHTRNILYSSSQRKIKIIDKVKGKGKHLVESFIHLHPDAEVSIDGNSAKVKVGEDSIFIEIIAGEFLVENSFYSPQFGIELGNKVLVIKIDGNIPAEISYTIAY